MITVTLCIGNSDNKLPQSEWSHYILEVTRLVHAYGLQVYFEGFSDPRAIWQNACWVFGMPSEESTAPLIRPLRSLAKNFRQESIALVVGNTHMVFPE